MNLLAAPKINRRAPLARFRQVRHASVTMCDSLRAEEYRLQPMEEVSPPWWNLGHTSWFFVRNVLAPFGGASEPEDQQYDYLLNSYYASLGSRLPRSMRGQVSRPTTEEIYRYRESVDHRVEKLIATVDDERFDDFANVLTIGMQHEQQHQELFFTEIKCILAQNPPALRRTFSRIHCPSQTTLAQPLRYVHFSGGLFEFGHREDTWCWDNELPLHKFHLQPFALADRLVTNGEYLQFIEDRGYTNQLLWLDNGWQACQREAWQAPLYWERTGGVWQQWTLSGLCPLALGEPVCHVSFYEAEAYARWRSQTLRDDLGVRLPSEREWERAARSTDSAALPNAFLESGRLHPAANVDDADLKQMHGCLWQWTSSYYEPYPGYRPFSGALTEYNGKFMDNQRVLRGGSCVTPRSHYRLSYRNFWPSPTRFQFTGIRLAQDAQ